MTNGMKGYNGEIMDTVIAVQSSDMCGIILQYLDKLVSFGDSISQASSSASAHIFRSLTSVGSVLGSSICQACLGRSYHCSQGSDFCIKILILRRTNGSSYENRLSKHCKTVTTESKRCYRLPSTCSAFWTRSSLYLRSEYFKTPFLQWWSKYMSVPYLSTHMGRGVS